MNDRRKRLIVNWLLVFFIGYLSVGIVVAAKVHPDASRKWKFDREKPTRGYVKLRDVSILTKSYVETNYSDFGDYDKIGILFRLTAGSLTSFQYRVLWSQNAVIWFYEGNETVTATMITDDIHEYNYIFSGTDNYFKVMPFYANYLKLEVKGTGTVTNSSCAVSVMGAW